MSHVTHVGFEMALLISCSNAPSADCHSESIPSGWSKNLSVRGKYGVTERRVLLAFSPAKFAIAGMSTERFEILKFQS
jgi:hypothetical protein